MKNFYGYVGNIARMRDGTVRLLYGIDALRSIRKNAEEECYVTV
jgi:hypothetical protein